MGRQRDCYQTRILDVRILLRFQRVVRKYKLTQSAAELQLIGHARQQDC
jgi:hypothetical protein